MDRAGAGTPQEQQPARRRAPVIVAICVPWAVAGWRVVRAATAACVVGFISPVRQKADAESASAPNRTRADLRYPIVYRQVALVKAGPNVSGGQIARACRLTHVPWRFDELLSISK